MQYIGEIGGYERVLSGRRHYVFEHEDLPRSIILEHDVPGDRNRRVPRPLNIVLPKGLSSNPDSMSDSMKAALAAAREDLEKMKE